MYIYAIQICHSMWVGVGLQLLPRYSSQQISLNCSIPTTYHQPLPLAPASGIWSMYQEPWCIHSVKCFIKISRGILLKPTEGVNTTANGISYETVHIHALGMTLVREEPEIHLQFFFLPWVQLLLILAAPPMTEKKLKLNHAFFS